MTPALFIGWVVFVFAVSDLVGGALRPRVFGPPAAPAPPEATPGRSTRDAAQSTLLGFAALWVALSVAYALGVATRGVMVGVFAASGIAAALVRRRHLAAWVRSRLGFWSVAGLVALLASCLRPTFTPSDDPEYFYLITKLLRTGSVVEYFNYRRPIALGGWTFIQAIFSAGPAGTAFVASIDAVVAGVLFLFCAALMEADVWTALAAAVLGILMVQGYQFNLGIAMSLGAMSAVLIGVSLADLVPGADFTAMTLAVMAVTIRPQLGLVALAAGAIVCLRRRARWYVPAGVAVALSIVWVVIFARDTGLLPLSVSPGYNPQTYALYAAPSIQPGSLVQQLVFLAEHHRRAVGLFALAVVVWVLQALASTRTAGERRSGRILGAFAVAVLATVLVMEAMLGAQAWRYARYYLPIAEGFTYACLAWIGVRALGRQPIARRSWVAALVLAGALYLAFGVLTGKLSVPAESSMRICPPVLTASERRAFNQLPRVTGYTVLELECPVGSFDLSPHVMRGDLFYSTRGDFVDVAWPREDVVSWLRKKDIGRLVYLEGDTGPNFRFDLLRRWAESNDRWKYEFESLEQLRDLARNCPTVRMPIADPQGPLVVVDLGQCGGRASPGPPAGGDHQ